MYKYALTLTLMCTSLFHWVRSSSSGDISICNAHSTYFGCDEHGLKEDGTTNRLNCTEQNPGFMHWALRPKPAPAYQIHTSLSEYTPNGTYITIEVRVTDYEWKYRGLLLHAVNSNGNTVGKWGLPNEPNYPFWHPTNCGEQYVLHNAAEEKALLQKFYYKTPPAGTGTISFRSIFKKGPANEGSFHYPMNVLSLTEKVTNSKLTSKWILAEVAQSCTAACRHVSLTCNDKELNSKSKAAPNVPNVLEQLFPCSLQLSDGCSIGAPGASPTNENHCWYHDKAICPKATTHTIQCNATSNKVKRFCYCSSQNERRELFVQGIQKHNKYEMNDEKEDETGNTLPPVYSNSCVLQPTYLILVLASFVACMSTISVGGNGSIGSMKNSFGILFMFVLLITQCLAHNWISVPGSRSKGASTPISRPCAPRHGTNVAAQLGPGQYLDFKFSTGHGTYAYIMIVPGHLIHHLATRDKVSFHAKCNV